MKSTLSVPLIMYHHIVPDDFSIASFRPGDRPYYSRISEFESHLEYIEKNNISTFNVCDLSQILKENDKKIAITFDDGQQSDFTIAFPRLAEKGLKATFYIITDFVGKKGWVTWEELKQIKASGMEIGSHSCSHRCFLDLDEEEAKQELEKSREILEQKLGCGIDSFSVPFGFADNRLIKLAKRTGYKTVCTSEVRYAKPGGRELVYGRFAIRRGDKDDILRGIVKKEFRTVGKIILKDNVKTLMKRMLGRGLWLKFRHLILLRQDQD